jgi:hypothetical protein
MASPSRRDFALALAAASTAAAEMAAASDSQPDAADGVLALLQARFGKHLTAAQWKIVAERVRGSAARAAALRRFPLRNSDDPAVAFRADLP